MSSRVDNRWLYSLLGVVFLLAASYQVCFSVGAVQYQQLARVEAAWPFGLSQDADRFSSVTKTMADSGVRPGDELLEVDGQPYRGAAQIAQVLESKRPGDRLLLKVKRQGRTEPELLSVPLNAEGSGGKSVLGWIGFAAITIFTPTFCLLLGFGVAAIRPRDSRAWLLLALMLSFAQISAASDTAPNVSLQWPDILRPAAIFYHVVCASTWSIWVFLFGIYFPERLELDRRLPWLKWLLIAPIFASGLGEALATAGDAENFRLFAPAQIYLAPLRQVVFFMAMAAISCFFFVVWTKIAVTPSADGRRRLILLVNGTGVALTPLFLVVVYGLITRRPFGDVPQPVWIVSVLMLALFPITLAYVIVVQRALDVRVVIRQGLRYALAKRGVRVMQFFAIAGVIWAAAMLATDPTRNRPAKIQAIGWGATALVLIGRGGERLRGWVDRRFFREAYDAELILRELSDQVRTMVETGRLLETVATQISGSMHVPRIAMLVKSNGHYALAHAVGFSEPPAVSFDSTGGTVAQLKTERQPLRVYFDNPDSWLYRSPSVTESEREQLQKLESQLLLPLAFKDKLIGFMSLGAKKSEEPFSTSDVHLLESVATQTGLALETSHLTEAIAVEVAQRERVNRELEIAREVQERLFPQSYPAVPGLDYAGRCRPAQGIGGDYYDFLALEGGRLGIAIGDVSGKGVPAALLMASLQASLRGQTISGTEDLAKLLSNMNRLIFDTSPSNRYATFFYGQYAPMTRQFTYVNAGHNAPMIFRNSEVLRLEDGGPVVGLFQAARYSQASVELAPGDVLLLYTDGISEAMNSLDDEWGEERMIEAVRAFRRRPALEMIEDLMRAADAFVAGAPQHDDMTITVVKIL